MLNPKCEGCGMAKLVTQTFCNIARLKPEEYYYSCLAMQERECLGEEEINIKEENEND